MNLLDQANRRFLERFPESKEIFLSDTNNAGVIGTMSQDFEFSHDEQGKKFFKSRINMSKKDGTEYHIPIIVSEKLLSSEICENKKVKVIGALRSYMYKREDGSHLRTHIFAKYLSVCNSEETVNYIYLKGFLCKDPIYRKTFKGMPITDLFIAVNEAKMTSYIPCIAWAGYAEYARQLKMGDEIEFWGRAQSRKYPKINSSGEIEMKETYEVSIAKWF